MTAEAVSSIVERLTPSQAKLVGRMWARPRSKPLVAAANVMTDALALQALGLLVVEAGDDFRDVLAFTADGVKAAQALRGAGEEARPPATPAARKPSLSLLRSELDAPAAAVERDGDARAEGGGRRPRKPERDPGEIYPGCPVRALGVHGKFFFYLDILGQLHAVDNHTKDRIRGLFGGRADLLMEQWPSWSRGDAPKIVGWKHEDAASAMQRAAAEKGVWNAFERVRGLGAWPDPDGGVALHCGDAVLYRGVWRGTGEIDGYVYPSAPKVPRPLEDMGSAEEPAFELLNLLDTWKWVRGDLDAYLLLGWICGAMFGGALDWRPLVWITGDKGTGKSTVQKAIRLVMGGEGAILQSTDATEAAVRQFLMQSTIPVALDELEADADPRKANAIIKLARQAASGGVVLRGGADHTGQEFRARSAFLFSSILHNPLLDQDISRIAMLELLPLDRGEASPPLDARRWGRVGRGLRARMLAAWPRLATTLELYRAALHRVGHDARGCDQFGTLLAMADLAMHDGAPDAARCDQWAARLSAEIVVSQTDASSDWQHMLNHLFGQFLDVYRGGDRHTVGWWVMAAAGMNEDMPSPKAKAALLAFGIRVEGRAEKATLTLANKHPSTSSLFVGTHWHGGVWSQAAKRVPGSTATKPVRFAGVLSRAYEFELGRIENFFDPGAPPKDDDPSPDQGLAEHPFSPLSPDDFA